MNESVQVLPLPENMLPEQVAWWFLRMQEQDCTAEERRAFESWLAASEVHRREYQQYLQLWYNYDYLEPKPVARWKGRGIVLLLMAGVFAGAMQWHSGRGATYATALGEPRQHAGQQYGGLLECYLQNPDGTERTGKADRDALQFE